MVHNGMVRHKPKIPTDNLSIVSRGRESSIRPSSASSTNRTVISSDGPTFGLWNKKISKKLRKYQLAVAVVLPIISVAFLASISVTRAWIARSEVFDLHWRMTIAQQLRHFIHDLQSERVQSCFFISTERHGDGTDYIKVFKKLLSQRTAIDQRIDELKDIPEAWPNQDGYRNAKEFQLRLLKKREKIDEQAITCIDVMDWFHEAIETFVGQIVYEFEHIGEGKLWGEINAYSSWILGKEEIGMTRALGTKLFSSGHLSQEEYSHFYELQGAGNMLLKYSAMSFEKVSEQEEKFQETNKELFTNISLLKTEILRNNISDGNMEKSHLWSTDMTKYSEILGSVEETITQSLLNELSARQFDYTMELILISVIAFFSLVLCPLLALYYIVQARYTKKLASKAKELLLGEQKTNNLLFQLLPKSIAKQILDGKSVPPESFKSATVFFSDILGFTALAAHSTPLQVVNLLNQLYIQFDSVLDMHDCYKVETIGDSFLVVSGLPKQNDPQHSAEMASVALGILCVISKFDIQHMPGQQLLIRVGLHTGSVVAGVVGTKRPTYCLFGDTVNTASRMESTSTGMRCQISETTRDHLRVNHPGFNCKLRGVQTIKGKGKMITYWLINKEGFSYVVDLEQTDHLLQNTTYFRSARNTPQPEGEAVPIAGTSADTVKNAPQFDMIPGQMNEVYEA